MRRHSRECAVQVLYQLDLGRHLRQGSDAAAVAAACDAALGEFWTRFSEHDGVDRVFAERLVRGVLDHREALDASIGAVAEGWRIERMNTVDRNVLRLAAYEIAHCPDVPFRVSINEALEIAKRYSGKDAVPFINGILDRLAQKNPGATR